VNSTLDVAWLPAELAKAEVRGGSAIVVDVVRATTSITTALASGARRVVPAVRVDEAREVAAANGAWLCGERGGVPPDGFDLGNSPSGFTKERIAGRTLVFTSTNGTAAMRSALAVGPRTLRLACFRNLGSVAEAVWSEHGSEGNGGVLVVCSGRKGRVSMDDGWCAGHLVRRLLHFGPGFELSDGAAAARELAVGLGAPTAAGLARMAAGRALGKLGLAEDLADCARTDDLRVVPIWRDGAFVSGGEGEENG